MNSKTNTIICIVGVLAVATSTVPAVEKFQATYDVDPASDGAEIYGTYNHLHLDLSQTEPGKEQKFMGYNWDLRNFGEPVRAGSSHRLDYWLVRRLQG